MRSVAVLTNDLTRDRQSERSQQTLKKAGFNRRSTDFPRGPLLLLLGKQFYESGYRGRHLHATGDFRAARFYQDDPADPSMYGVLEGLSAHPTATLLVNPIDGPTRASFVRRPRVSSNPYVLSPVNHTNTDHFFDCLTDRFLGAGLISRESLRYLRTLADCR